MKSNKNSAHIDASNTKGYKSNTYKKQLKKIPKEELDKVMQESKESQENIRGALQGYMGARSQQNIPSDEESKKDKKNRANNSDSDSDSGSFSKRKYVKAKPVMNTDTKHRMIKPEITKEKSLNSSQDEENNIKGTFNINTNIKNKPPKTYIERQKKQIKSVKCSENNTALTSHSGDLYIFGSLIYDLIKEAQENLFTPLQPKRLRIRKIGLGSNHILMLTFSSEVFGAGCNDDGQLGLGYSGGNVPVQNAKKIEFFSGKSPFKVYAAEDYSIVLTKEAYTKTYIFGSNSFLQGSAGLSKQLTPLEEDWGKVEKVACGSSHILLVVKEENGLTIKAVGNGMYGKLGNNDPSGRNKYDPIRCQIPYYEIRDKKSIKIRCGKYTSGALLKNEDSNEHKFYMWGLCHHELFAKPNEVKQKHNFGSNFPFDAAIPIISPVLITSHNIVDFAIGEGICYFIRAQSNKLVAVGKFPQEKAKSKEIITENFSKVSVGLNHAAGLNVKNKLFTWGNNVSCKLGIVDEEPVNNTFSSQIGFKTKYTASEINDTNLEEYKHKYSISRVTDKYFIPAPTNVVQINDIFKEEEPKLKALLNKDKANLEENETPTSDIKIETEANESVYKKARKILKFSDPSFDQLSSTLTAKENEIKTKSDKILQAYDILHQHQVDAKRVNKSLKNIFFFKFSGEPFKLDMKSSNFTTKFPYEFYAYKKNFRAILSLLHTHPCYLLKMYEHQLMPDDDLYKVIKQIYGNTLHETYNKYLIISLIKGILLIDLQRQKIKDMSEYKVIKEVTEQKEKLTLFAKLVRFLFDADCEFVNRQETAALLLVSNVFSSVTNPTDCASEMLLKNNPNYSGEFDYNNYERNSRVDKICKQYSYFLTELLAETNKSSNHSLLSPIYEYTPLFALPKILKLLVAEITAIFREHVTSDAEKIKDWVAAKFAVLVFKHLLRVLEDPRKRLAFPSVLTRVDKNIFNQFMQLSAGNFYSVAYVFRFFFRCLAFHNIGALTDDSLNKKLEKIFRDNYYSDTLTQLKNLLFEPEKSEDKSYFDLLLMSEFFKHSLTDSNYVINFSVNGLKALYNTIVSNIEKVRILNDNSDIMDQILKYNNFKEKIGNKMNIDAENDRVMQFKLKTKTISLKKNATVNRCRKCKNILLSDYILGNELPIYEQITFINKTSPLGLFCRILKNVENFALTNDNFNDFLRHQYNKNKENVSFINNINQMFIKISIDNKDELLLNEDTISDRDKLFDFMFNTPKINRIYKSYCKEILKIYYDMKDKNNYYDEMSKTLNEIEALLYKKEQTYQRETANKINKTLTIMDNSDEPNDNNDTPREDKSDKPKPSECKYLCSIYKRVRSALFKGYANDEVRSGDLYFKCMRKRIMDHNDTVPKKKNMKNKAAKVSTEYNIKKMIDKGVIKDIKNHKEILKNPELYYLEVIKKDNFEFECVLLESSGEESFFACGSKNSEKNKKRLQSFVIQNDLLADIISAYVAKSDKPFKLGKFLEINYCDVIKIVREIFCVGEV